MIVLHKTFSLILSAAVVTVPCVQGQQTPKQPPPAQLAPKTVPDQVQLFIPYKQYSREDNNRILKLYEPLRVSDVSDGMDVIGLQDIGIADEAIQPLWRDTVNFTHRIVGIAVTARYVPTNKRPAKIPPEEVDNWYANITGEPFMDALFPGCVLVIDAEGDGDTRSIGSTNILDWKKLGMVGVITSGGLADSDEIISHKVPAYHKRKGRGFRPGRFSPSGEWKPASAISPAVRMSSRRSPPLLMTAAGRNILPITSMPR